MTKERVIPLICVVLTLVGMYLTFNEQYIRALIIINIAYILQVILNVTSK